MKAHASPKARLGARLRELPLVPRSFRVRIALLSTCLSGLVLLLFGAYSWVIVERAAVAQVDNQIREVLTRNLMRPPWVVRSIPVDDLLAEIYGDDFEERAMLRIETDEPRHVQQSLNWPVDLDLDISPSPRPPHIRGDAFIEHGPMSRGLGPEPRHAPGRGPGRGRGMDGPGPPPRELGYTDVVAQQGRWRLGIFELPGAVFAFGLNLENNSQELMQARQAFLFGLPVGLLLIGAGGFLLAQRALRPVQALREMAERIEARGLDQRMNVVAADEEFARLIAVFNSMLDRLQRSFQQATRFSADAAHELKTPLAILQGNLEQAIQEATDGSPEQERYGKLLAEVHRLKSITRKLLLLAQADAGQLRLKLTPMNLSELVEEMLEDARVLAPQLEITSEIDPGVVVAADPDLLRQVVQNLINNAIKYNRSGGEVAIRVKRSGKRSVLRVGNTGSGISVEDRERIFERFYRTDKSRSRTQEGVGLGLSLSREIARAHRGDLFLDESLEDRTVFTLELPLGEAT